MSSSTSSASERIVPQSPYGEATTDFVRWGLAQLGYTLSEENGASLLRLRESDEVTFDGRRQLRLPLGDRPVSSDVESIDFGARFGSWLLERLSGGGPVVHVRPREQPLAVNDISQRLFEAYQVEGGQVHLAGCQLADYPFLRMSFAVDDGAGATLRHVFVAHDGSSVSPQQVEDLGLLDVERLGGSAPRIDEPALQSLMAAGRRVAAKSSTSRDPTASIVEPSIVSVVWVKHASGTLDFTIGDSSVQLPFSGWAKLIRPQPFVASNSGASTFHLAATDDGRIDDVDQIVRCEQSGRRVLQQDLATCSVTGKKVLEDFVQSCPVSGRPALKDQFVTCPVCQQRVSKTTVDDGACQACRSLTKASKEDPRLAWILGEHAGLDSWKSWRLAETQQVYIAQANRLMKRMLVVIDKETLAVRHLAQGSRLASDWTAVPEDSYAEFLD